MASLSPLSVSNISRGLRPPKSASFFNTRRLQVLRLNRFLIRCSSRRILDGKTETERLNSQTQEGLPLEEEEEEEENNYDENIEADIPREHEPVKITDGDLELLERVLLTDDSQNDNNMLLQLGSLSCGITSWLSFVQVAESSERVRADMVYEIGELFELGIQLSYLLILLGLLGIGTFFVIRQVLVRRELDLSAKELQEQVRSGDASATEYFELGAVMLRRKFYPAAIKYLQQAIEKWDRDDQDLAQVYNALGVSYVRDNKLDKGITQFETAVKLQPGYVTAWNNLGDAYEKKKDLRAALKAFEEVLLFDPNNKVARPRRDALRDRVQLYKGVPIKSEDR